MFLGMFERELDQKGRLVLPAKYREVFRPGLVITEGQERCLYVFTWDEFTRITEMLRDSPFTSRALRDYNRVFFSTASDENLDNQGRITIPHNLRKYASLIRNCTVIGANTRLEIWDHHTWDTYQSQMEITYSNVDEEVLPGSWSMSPQVMQQHPFGIRLPGHELGR
jgi:MraZ protein